MLKPHHKTNPLSIDIYFLILLYLIRSGIIPSNIEIIRLFGRKKIMLTQTIRYSLVLRIRWNESSCQNILVRDFQRPTLLFVDETMRTLILLWLFADSLLREDEEYILHRHAVTDHLLCYNFIIGNFKYLYMQYL